MEACGKSNVLAKTGARSGFRSIPNQLLFHVQRRFGLADWPLSEHNLLHLETRPNGL
jgi:hypothetical protein